MSDATGSIATAMAAATGSKAKQAPAERAAFPFTVSGFRLEDRPSEWTPKNGAYTRKRVGSALITIANIVEMPVEIAVLFPKDGKPKCIAELPKIRFKGSMFVPATHLSKKEQDAVLAQMSKLETSAADGFVTWYRKQDGVPALTSRVSGASLSGVDIDD
jgi:hypothetical protein